MKTPTLVIFTILLSFLSLSTVWTQDSLSFQNLSEISYAFTIEEGKLIGPGAEFLQQKVKKSQFTLLGEFHGSKNISQFTKALLPTLANEGYQNMILEVGPYTGEFLDTLSDNSTDMVAKLKRLNQKYIMIDEEKTRLPIPFFEHVEDGEFLGTAKSLGWKIIGIDQEFMHAYIWLVDCMFENLPVLDQYAYKNELEEVKKSIRAMYSVHTGRGTPVYSSMLSSKNVQNFLNVLGACPQNTELRKSIQKSLELYQLNAAGRWYDNNKQRVALMKENLRTNLNASGFDIAKEKLFVKMGAYHLSLGFSPMSFYEVGNMLNEIAEFNGNKALNMGFKNRYWEEDGKVLDELDDAWNLSNKKNIFGMGRKEEWIVINLEPIRAGYYYHPQKYIINEWEEKLIQQYDVLIITPTESEGQKNY
ncbi:MAG: hypothetical protein P1U56_10050 [Saprospiraceae bacterium]|nr:hypothetical protein [Saprospiraceae bacterium]